MSGRPREYTEEIGNAICQQMSEGKSLRQVCSSEEMPATSTVMRWAIEIPAFSEQYARARGLLLEHWAEDIVEIADGQDEDPQSRRVRIDTRKWLLSKLLPKKYGDKLSLGGIEDAPPIKTACIRLVRPPEQAAAA